MITAVVFDMDGLLFDTEKLGEYSWCACAEEMGVPDVDKIYNKFIGLNRNDGNALLLDIYGKDFPVLEFRERASQIFHEKIERDGLPVKPWAREILQWLKDHHVKTAMASSTRKVGILSHLERAGFTEYFQLIVGGDMVEHSKPEPDIYLKACELLGEDPATVAAVEDSPNGIRSAARAGMLPLMVPDMVEPTEEIQQLYHRCFRSLKEVQEYLSEQCVPADRTEEGK